MNVIPCLDDKVFWKLLIYRASRPEEDNLVLLSVKDCLIPRHYPVTEIVRDCDNLSECQVD